MFSLTRLIVVLLVTASPVVPQTTLSDSGVEEVVAYYKNVNIKNFEMPPAITDPLFRATIHKQLPEYKRVRNQQIIDNLWRVLTPVLSLYGRTGVYEILVIHSTTPLMMSDSGVVLVISTGMIKRAESDDELLGYAAHEVAHEYFAQYSIYTKHLLGLITKRGNESALKHHLLQMLAVIEIQCDIFAALTLASAGYDPFAFIRGVEQTERSFPGQVGNHPPAHQRSFVLNRVLTGRGKPRRSAAFKQLIRLLDSKSF